MGPPPTLLHVLHAQASLLGVRAALWTQRGATFIPTSWHDYGERVRRCTLGLRAPSGA